MSTAEGKMLTMDNQPSLVIRDFDVVLKGFTDITPLLNFRDAGMKQVLQKNVDKMFHGRSIPTAVQKFSIPAINDGLHVVGLSQTGSGKTGAYLIPLISSLLKNFKVPNSERWAPEILIIAPTRELSYQIYLDAKELAAGTAIVAGCVYGGKDAERQLADAIKLKEKEGVKIKGKGAHILTGTPGRLVDLINRFQMTDEPTKADQMTDEPTKAYQMTDDTSVDLSLLRAVVIDEADHMLEGDFRIVEEIFKNETFLEADNVQYLFFSATTSKFLENEILAITGQKKDKPIAHAKNGKLVSIEVGKIGRANNDIQQVILDVPAGQKYTMLLDILAKEPTKSLIFTNTKLMSKKIMTYLLNEKYPAGTMNSNTPQVRREQVLQRLKNDKIKCLVVTDIACRGIHIPGPLHVINFDLPAGQPLVDRLRTYVHRIGRTGRMGEPGKATSFFCRTVDSQLGPSLYYQLLDRSQPVPEVIMEYKREAELQGPPKKPKGSKKVSRPAARRLGPPTTTKVSRIINGPVRYPNPASMAGVTSKMGFLRL